MTSNSGALPEPMATMLIGELKLRLDSLALAIGTGQLSRCAHERARIEMLLASLQADRLSKDGEDDPRAGLFRAVGRMVVLAVAHGDPTRCRQACDLLATSSKGTGGGGSFVNPPHFVHKVVRAR